MEHTMRHSRLTVHKLARLLQCGMPADVIESVARSVHPLLESAEGTSALSTGQLLRRAARKAERFIEAAEIGDGQPALRTGIGGDTDRIASRKAVKRGVRTDPKDWNANDAIAALHAASTKGILGATRHSKFGAKKARKFKGDAVGQPRPLESELGRDGVPMKKQASATTSAGQLTRSGVTEDEDETLHPSSRRGTYMSEDEDTSDGDTSGDRDYSWLHGNEDDEPMAISHIARDAHDAAQLQGPNAELLHQIAHHLADTDDDEEAGFHLSEDEAGEDEGSEETVSPFADDLNDPQHGIMQKKPKAHYRGDDAEAEDFPPNLPHAKHRTRESERPNQDLTGAILEDQAAARFGAHQAL